MSVQSHETSETNTSSLQEAELTQKWFITCACLDGDCENCPSDAHCAHSCHVPDEKMQAERGPAAEYLYRIGDIHFNGDRPSFCWDMTDSQLGEWAVKTLTNYAKSTTLLLAEEAEQEALEHDRLANELRDMSHTQDAVNYRWFAAWLREKAR